MIFYHEYFKDLFYDVQGESTTFVETGTSGGNGVKAALIAGYEKIYSMEIFEEQYNITKNNFKEEDESLLNTKIFLYLGDSKIILPDILKLIPSDIRSVFWIDAHTSNSVTAYEELEIIKTHSLKNHTILVDDIPLYFENASELKEKIWSINSNYKIELINCPILNRIDYRLIAYV